MRETSIILIERNMTGEEIRRVIGIDDLTPDPHAELTFRLGGMAPTADDLFKVFYSNIVLGVASLAWGTTESFFRRRKALLAPVQ